MTVPRSWDTRVAWLVGGVIAVVLTLAYTAPYGTLNQATYLLDPLHRAMPGLYHHDWFVSETPPYLPTFGWAAAWLFQVDPEGPTAVLAAHVLVTLATYVAMYWLATTVSRDSRMFAIVTSVSAVTLGRTLGGNYLLAGYLQPSSIATVGWIVAMAALVRGRYLVCGVALALAGLMHVNFLVLGIGLFTLAALARRDATRGEIFQLIAPQLVVLAYYFADLLAAAGPSTLAVRILVEFHAPGHYAGVRLAARLPELASWQLAAFAVLPLHGDVGREARVLWRFSLLVFAISVVTTLIVMIPALESLTQVRWSRIAPFGQLACQVLVVGGLLRYATVPALSIARRALVMGSIVLAVLFTCRFLHQSLVATVVVTGSIVAVFGVPTRFCRHAATAVAVVVVVGALWASPRGAGLTTVPAGSSGERSLASWARRETSPDALFLTPPGMARFRLLTRRAIVVDTKSPPLRPDLLVAWYRRLCAVVQVTDAKTHEWVEQRWTQLTPSQLETVARSFDADYIVVAATVHLSGQLAYANDEYAVYRVPR